MYEVHITTTYLIPSEIDGFIRFCEEISSKPIIIELEEGEVAQQPMISKTFRGISSDELHSQINYLESKFQQAGYEVSRIKVEVPLDFIEEGVLAFPEYQGQYYEWHGKVRFSDLDVLKKSAKKWRYHLSRNSLKGEPNLRFITIRAYKFQQEIIREAKRIHTVLKHDNLFIEKEEFEYCIYDSNKTIDKGWLDTPRVTKEFMQKLIVFESFLKRAVLKDDMFILKGSLLTRQYLLNKDVRLVNDLDFVYGLSIDDDELAMAKFDKWIRSVKEIELNDDIEFKSRPERELWKFTDYEMNSDFPTAQTSLSSFIDNCPVEYDVSMDISWNLPIEEELAELLYFPVEGEPFTVKYTVPLSLQLSWKLHQTVVRPRSKDLIDIVLLLEANSLSLYQRRRVAYHFVKECMKDGFNPNRLFYFIDGEVFDYYTQNKQIIESKIGTRSFETPFGFKMDYNMGLVLYDVFNMEIKYQDIGELLLDFSKNLQALGIRSLIMEEFNRLKP